jgi:hypothetical protein
MTRREAEIRAEVAQVPSPPPPLLASGPALV